MTLLEEQKEFANLNNDSMPRHIGGVYFFLWK